LEFDGYSAILAISASGLLDFETISFLFVGNLSWIEVICEQWASGFCFHVV
jgi:hypothetical protein